MKALLVLVILLAGGTARAATLSGDVSCEGCGPVAVRLVWGPSPLGPALITLTLDAPGPWSVVVADDTGFVGAYAFEDLDGDGAPDPGAAVTGYASNPIDVGTQAITGIHLAVTPAEAQTVTVSGTVTCPGCDIVRVRLSPYASATPSWLEVELTGLVGSTPWSVEVPPDLGALWVFGAASATPDIDDDAWVAFPDNPVTIGETDVTGVDLALSEPPDRVVVLSGSIACPSCEGGVGVEVHLDGALGPIVLVQALATPGAFLLSLPLDLGAVALVAFRDDDGDGVADLEAALGPYAQNPVTVGQDDIGGVTLVVPEAGGAIVALSGTVACADCVGGGVALRLGSALGPQIVATAMALGSGSGAWSLRVPTGLGEVALLAFRDDDRDGLPDLGQPLGEYAQNPVAVGAADVTGLALSVPAKAVTGVTVSGTVACSDCAGAVGVRVHLGVVDGPVFVLVSLGAPGPFAIALPIDLGDVALVAFRDDDFDGLPDVGADEAEYAENPVTIGSSDVSGVALTLLAGGAATVTVSGRVECDDCAGGVGLVAVDDGGATLVRVHLAEPGPFAFVLGRDAGPVSLSAYRDADADFLPDEGSPLVPYPANPVVIESQPVSGVVIDLTPVSEADPGPEPAPESGSEDVDNGDAVDVGEVIDATEDIATEDIATEDIATEDVATEDVATEDVATEDIATEDIATGDVATEDVATADVDASDTDLGPEPDAEPTADAEPDVAEQRSDQGGCGCSGGGGGEAAVWVALALLLRAGRRRVETRARGGLASPYPNRLTLGYGRRMRLIRNVLLSFLPIAIGCGDSATEKTDVITTDTVTAADTAVTADAADTTVEVDTADTVEVDTADTADTVEVDTADTVEVDTADTVEVDTADTTLPEDVAIDVEDTALGPVGMSVFFASTADFSSTLEAHVSSDATHVVGTGDHGTLEVIFAGTSVGTYPCGATSTNVIWTQSESNVQSSKASPDGQCTIVVTRFGAVGERVEGTFDGVMGHADDMVGFGIPYNDGTFSVVRGSDL